MKTEHLAFTGQSETDRDEAQAIARYHRLREQRPTLWTRLRAAVEYALFWQSVIVLVMGSALGLLFWLAVR